MTCWNLIQQMWPSELSFMSILSKLKAWTGQRQQSNLDQDAQDQHHQLPRSVTSFCITCPMLNNLFSDIVSILLRIVLFFSILQSFVSWVSKHVLLMLSYYRTKFSPNDSFIANIYSDLIAILFRNCFENIDGFMNDLQLYLGWFQINISASALLNQAWLFKSFSNSGSTFWQLIK